MSSDKYKEKANLVYCAIENFLVLGALTALALSTLSMTKGCFEHFFYKTRKIQETKKELSGDFLYNYRISSKLEEKLREINDFN